ncbi:MAG TPA: hypothetical protein VML75_06565 [Kofleriaceae bacterium]|nr:hypothetical protein [Kofleriaceae bacterium]
MIAFPRRHLSSLNELAARAIDRHGRRYSSDILARDLLVGFFEVCLHAGLDGVLFELEQAFAPLEITDGAALAEDPRIHSALVAKLGDASSFDPRGPRSAKPQQLADCLTAVLSLDITDPPARTLSLPDEVRTAMVGALAAVLETRLAAPQIRAAIIAAARDLCEPQYSEAFDQIAAQLDARGLSLPPQIRMPLSAVQAARRALVDGRILVVERAAHAAIDRAVAELAPVSAEAAARIERPITHRWTPRDVAVARAADARVLIPEAVVQLLMESLAHLAELAWLAPPPMARAYAPSETFARGDLLDHPTFGRGRVEAVSPERIEVEFAEGWRTLAHGRSRT